MNHILSIYAGHDASISFFDKDKIRVIEYERFVKRRYSLYSKQYDYHCLGSNDQERKLFLEYLKNHINPTHLIYNELCQDDINLIKEVFPNLEFIPFENHHTSHAASGYFTSKFDNAIIFSIDGGGKEYGIQVFTKIFKGENDKITDIETIDIDFGGAYYKLGKLLTEISAHVAMSYSGKLMALSSYGKIQNDLIPLMEEYYLDNNMKNYYSDFAVNKLHEKLGNIDITLGRNLIATSQHIFEELFLKRIFFKYFNESNNFIMVGGCSLNVILNQRLMELCQIHNKSLYIPPVPNDSGLSLGQLLYYTKQKISTNIVYNGIPLINHLLPSNGKKYTIKDICKLLQEGKILGIVKDDSEIGPRALGNRSIICHPKFGKLKDIINSKIKFREWFRPFAPICREEDINTFFKNGYSSKYMSLCPTIREEYINKLPAILHVNNTARLQTISKEDNEFIYSILTELEKLGEYPILLNTSFNIKGTPILNSIKDAMLVKNTTPLDHVIINDYLF